MPFRNSCQFSAQPSSGDLPKPIVHFFATNEQTSDVATPLLVKPPHASSLPAPVHVSTLAPAFPSAVHSFFSFVGAGALCPLLMKHMDSSPVAIQTTTLSLAQALPLLVQNGPAREKSSSGVVYTVQDAPYCSDAFSLLGPETAPLRE
jgi:hypothetical protein